MSDPRVPPDPPPCPLTPPEGYVPDPETVAALAEPHIDYTGEDEEEDPAP